MNSLLSLDVRTRSKLDIKAFRRIEFIFISCSLLIMTEQRPKTGVSNDLIRHAAQSLHSSLVITKGGVLSRCSKEYLLDASI